MELKEMMDEDEDVKDEKKIKELVSRVSHLKERSLVPADPASYGS